MRLEDEDDARQRINKRSLLNILDDCTLRCDELVRVAERQDHFRQYNIYLLSTSNFPEIDDEGLWVLKNIKDGNPELSTVAVAVGGLEKMLAALHTQISYCPALSCRLALQISVVKFTDQCGEI